MNFHQKHCNASKASDLESTQIQSNKKEGQTLSLARALLLSKGQEFQKFLLVEFNNKNCLLEDTCEIMFY